MMIAHRRIAGSIAAPALSAILNIRRLLSYERAPFFEAFATTQFTNLEGVQAAACDAMKALVAIRGFIRSGGRSNRIKRRHVCCWPILLQKSVEGFCEQ